MKERNNEITELEAKYEEQERKLAFHQAVSQGHKETAARLGALSANAHVAEQDIKMKDKEIEK